MVFGAAPPASGERGGGHMWKASTGLALGGSSPALQKRERRPRGMEGREELREAVKRVQ